MHANLRWICNLFENWAPGSLLNSTFLCLHFRDDNFSYEEADVMAGLSVK